MKGKLVVAANPGAAGKPWRGLPRTLWSDGATAFDYEGNRRLDFLVVTVDGGITLANRGYGAFLINRYVHQ